MRQVPLFLASALCLIACGGTEDPESIALDLKQGGSIPGKSTEGLMQCQGKEWPGPFISQAVAMGPFGLDVAYSANGDTFPPEKFIYELTSAEGARLVFNAAQWNCGGGYTSLADAVIEYLPGSATYDVRVISTYSCNNTAKIYKSKPVHVAMPPLVPESNAPSYQNLQFNFIGGFVNGSVMKFLAINASDDTMIETLDFYVDGQLFNTQGGWSGVPLIGLASQGGHQYMSAFNNSIVDGLPHDFKVVITDVWGNQTPAAFTAVVPY